MSAAVAGVSTVEIAAAVEAATAVELSASVEVAPTVTVAAMEVSAAVPAIVAASIAAMTVIAVLAVAIISTATVAVSAAVIAVIPGAGADEDAANEPVRAIKTVGRAGVWIVIVVAIFADRRGAVINRGPNSDAERYALGVRVGS